MGPFTLGDIYKEHPWGGTRLRGWACGGKPTGRAAEAWKLAAEAGADCAVLDGPWKGATLSQVARDHPEIVSPGQGRDDPFPLAIRLLDARLPLPIQAIPGGQGKMWYILDCVPGAFLYIGFQGATARGAAEQAAADGRLAQLLHKVEVHRGDHYFIPPGTVHAIGGGILLAEITQNAGLAGAPIAEKFPAGAHLGPAGLECFGSARVRAIRGGRREVLLEYPWLQAEILQVDGTLEAGPQGAFLSLLCLGGRPALRAPGVELPAQRGASLLVPADAGAFTLAGQGKFLVLRPSELGK